MRRGCSSPSALAFFIAATHCANSVVLVLLGIRPRMMVGRGEAAEVVPSDTSSRQEK